MNTPIEGFSKLNKQEKIKWLCDTYFPKDGEAQFHFSKYENQDETLQKLHDEFIENTVSNYYLPFAVAPNFNINGKLYTIPMAIEESSVVAAVSKAAKFWGQKGGFKAEVVGTEKIGQVHFMYEGEKSELENFISEIKPLLIEECKPITANMEKRGGGILNIDLRDKTSELANYYQLHACFKTLDAMGANFINSCLEQFAKTLLSEAEKRPQITGKIEVVMSILSNYVPNCLVKASVSCPVELLATKEMTGLQYAKKFVRAIAIANAEVHRATTHNKGIMNGIDAVVIATGNDFRAVEAGVHAYASRSGKYQSLTLAYIKNEIFHFSIELPLALGTVGGLTKLHPLVKTALQILGNPSAKELMQITAVVGLAQNFGAINSLITSGIQKGHMKMHLLNILNQFNATEQEKEQIINHFKDKIVSHSAVIDLLREIRKKNHS